MSEERKNPHILIVQANRYNIAIVDAMLKSAKEILDRHGATYDVRHVNGAIKISTRIAFAANTDVEGPYDGYVAIGCTDKENIGTPARLAVTNVANNLLLAVGNGIRDRKDPDRDRGGIEAATACLDMIRIRREYGIKDKKPTAG